MAKIKASEYKPLLYTTTIRNPERYKDFMCLLYKYNGQILTDNLITQFECDTFRVGLYRPNKLPLSVKKKWSNAKKGELAEIALTEKECATVAQLNDPRFDTSIKGHKEAGFDRGWPSRFDTQFKLMKRFGFVYYEMGKAIEFSRIGEYMAQIVSIEIIGDVVNREVVHPEYEQMAFLQAMVREQRCNPFINELNDNVPLILLLKTIKKLNADPEYNNCGIAKHELPLLIFWKDNDADTLYRRIKKLRSEFGYKPSNEVIQEICTEEILGGFKKFKLKSIVQEYPDDFIRKMRLTGLISLRGAGRFIDINHNEDDKVEYVLSHYSIYEKYDEPKQYFDYIASIDPVLFDIKPVQVTESQSVKYLETWAEFYNWDVIKKELTNLAEKRSSQDDILKFIPAPARLEFLVAVAIKSKLPSVIVMPNYICDDTGLPTSTAGGNQGDIECQEIDHGILVEVTMAEGRTQTMMEIWPIERHLVDFKQKIALDSQCMFVAPSIYSDSFRQIKFVKQDAGHIIRPYKVQDFINYLETSSNLYENRNS